MKWFFFDVLMIDDPYFGGFYTAVAIIAMFVVALKWTTGL